MPKTDTELSRHATFLNKDKDPKLLKLGANKDGSRCAKDLKNSTESKKAPSNANKKLPIRVMLPTKSGGSSRAGDRSNDGLPRWLQS